MASALTSEFCNECFCITACAQSGRDGESGREKERERERERETSLTRGDPEGAVGRECARGAAADVAGVCVSHGARPLLTVVLEHSRAE